MSAENLEIIRAWYEAFNRGDMDAVLASLTEDFEMRVPAYAVDGISYLGRDGYEAWYEGLKESWSSARVTPVVVAHDGQHVVLELTAELVGLTSGTPIAQLFWGVAWMDDGKISRFHSFPGKAEALEAAGLAE